MLNAITATNAKPISTHLPRPPCSPVAAQLPTAAAADPTAVDQADPDTAHTAADPAAAHHTIPDHQAPHPAAEPHHHSAAENQTNPAGEANSSTRLQVGELNGHNRIDESVGTLVGGRTGAVSGDAVVFSEPVVDGATGALSAVAPVSPAPDSARARCSFANWSCSTQNRIR